MCKVVQARCGARDNLSRIAASCAACPAAARPLSGALLLAFCLGMGSSPSHAGTIDLPFQVGGAYAVPAISLKEARYLATVRQQYDFSCGSAALSTLLTHHYQLPVTEQEVFEAMFVHGDKDKIRREGFSLLDMKRYLEGRGFHADGFEAPLDKLAEAGIPAIVLVNESGYNHFVVVKGMRAGRVLIGDPAAGTRAVGREAFEGMWTNRILFVIAASPRPASFNASSDWKVARRAPLDTGVARDGLQGVVLPRHGPTDF